jgi:twitching motility two-component system response regulator PilH
MAHTNPATILVVDDDVELLDAYRMVLEEEGHRVLTAHSGSDALALARRERPDVLVSDIVMPVMDGFELIGRLQAELGGSAPPAIVCSGFDITEKEALRRGARIFLPKPTDAATLLRAVEALKRPTGMDPASQAQNRRRVHEERSKVRSSSQSELFDLDREGTARGTRPWLEWLQVYLQCSGACVLLLQEPGLRKLVASGAFPSESAANAFLRTNVTCVVETRTSLVIGDARRHPSFRQTLAPDADIAFFAGVPLLTPVDVAVGALCVSDSSPRRFDAESLVMLEHLGRRGVSQLVVHQHDPPGELPRSPLLAQVSFQTLLANELKIAARSRKAVEMAMVRLPAGVPAHACAVQLWRVGAGPRTAIGDFGPDQVGFFKSGNEREVSRLLSVCLESARSQGLLLAAGVVSINGTGGLSDQPLLQLAQSALAAATSAGANGNANAGGRIQRIVVRPDA